MTEIGKAYIQIVPSMQGFGDQVKSTINSQSGNAGESGGKTFGEKFKNAAGVGIKAIGAGIAAAGAAAVALAKSSLEGYAEYEQLVGGVETLFKDSAGQVQEYAANAYQTAGMSANEYMETVTSFSASLLQSLEGDTGKAAEYANTAITDMSDNANKMGSSIESIQNAYQGFAKQNYTMLDNLKLGYGGTKSEMERLVTDAEKLDSSFKAARDTNGDLALSYSDIIDAIHIVQTDMGITGTTAEEASKTISGSLASAKAAWSNLVVGVADENANLEQLIDNFIDSVVTAGENIIPRVEQIMSGLGTLINAAAERLVPLIVTTIVNNLPQIVQSGVQLIVTLAGALIQALPQLIAAIPEIFRALVSGFQANWPQIQQAGRDIIDQLGNTLRSLGSQALQWGKDMMGNFINGIKSMLGGIAEAARSAASTAASYLHFSEPDVGPLSDFHTFAPDMMRMFADGITRNIGTVKSAIGGLTGMMADEMGAETGVNALRAGTYTASRALPAASGNSGTQTVVKVKFEGSMAPLAMILQPLIEVETLRVGESYAPA